MRPLVLQTNRRLAEFSTFGIGGPIGAFVEVSSIEEMEEAYRHPGPKLIIGKGSNSLFPDEGFSGLVILNKIDFCSWKENTVTVGAGYSFSLLGVQSARKQLSGLEFASGIPASVGGAVFMNAGANGKETADCLTSVLYFDGTRQELSKASLFFGYRSSSFQTMPGAILAATFALQPQETARETQLKIIDYRMKTQPLKERSIGCIFRNPPSGSAGELIDRCGLKGLSVGGAKVSEIHANFIVNVSQASARDVQELISQIQQKVLAQTGIVLTPEIRMVEPL